MDAQTRIRLAIAHDQLEDALLKRKKYASFELTSLTVVLERIFYWNVIANGFADAYENS